VPVAVFGVFCGKLNEGIVTGTIKHCKMGPEIKKKYPLTHCWPKTTIAGISHILNLLP